MSQYPLPNIKLQPLILFYLIGWLGSLLLALYFLDISRFFASIFSNWFYAFLWAVMIKTIGYHAYNFQGATGKPIAFMKDWFPYLFVILPLSFLFIDLFDPLAISLNDSQNIVIIVDLAIKIIAVFISYSVLSDYFDKRLFMVGQPISENESLVREERKLNENPILDSVIQSILLRASNAGKYVLISLIVIIGMVMVGGAASFGTVALDEAKKVRELESERIKLSALVNELSEDDPNLSYIKDIIENKYGSSSDYEELLVRIEENSNFSWPDIVMRITIAALTIFLVQIFFHIYKYNQREASNLSSKVETLTLYKEENANHDELRKILLSKINDSVNFDKNPTSPTEQMINFLEKSKNKD